MRRRLLWLCAALALLPGCGTINSYASGCGGPYSGIRPGGGLPRTPPGATQAGAPCPPEP